MPRKRQPDAAERRRRQNAESQRAYRARQKQRVRGLEQLVASALASQNTAADEDHVGAVVTPAAFFTATSTDPNLCVWSGIASPAAQPTRELYRILRPVSDDKASEYYRVMVREHFAIRDVVKYGLIAMGYAMSPELFKSAASLPFRGWAELVESSYAGLDIKQAVSAGVELLAQLDAPHEWPPFESLKQPCPKLNTNNITMRQMSFASAILTNALQLRIPPEALMDDEAQSRFLSFGSETSELEEDMQRNNMHIAIDLAPTAEQRNVPHHPCFDLIPWPYFRTKVIQATSADPPLIDEDDLCLDVFGGGLRCWGSARGSAHGHGQGVPWDSRSWEAMPWFLAKWGMITGGAHGDISRTSSWWRAMRGDEGDETERWPYL